MTIKEVKEKLNELGTTNKPYYNNVVPGSKKCIGVTIPKLRILAKKISKGNYKEFLDNNTRELFELDTLQALVIGLIKDDINISLKYLDDFVPSINDWSVNDTICQSFKMARKYPKETMKIIKKYSKSKKEYEVRFVAIILMSHYLNDEYIDEVIKIINNLYIDKYYSKMAVAWAVATIMAKYRDKCIKYMKSNNNKLDKWTYNKAIQKMKESYRVSNEDKILINSLKK